MANETSVTYYESMEVDSFSTFLLESKRGFQTTADDDKQDDTTGGSSSCSTSRGENTELRSGVDAKTNNMKTSVKFASCTSIFHGSDQDSTPKDVSNSNSNNSQKSQQISEGQSQDSFINSVIAPVAGLNQLPCAEDFVLLKPISKGAFGKVWLGFKKTNPNKMYAIKVMKKADLINKNLIAQVTTERDAQARSQSAFVVQIYYSLQSRQNIFLIMEYMIGGDVKSLLIMYGFFSEEMACFYAAEVTLALAYLHKLGIVHRDLKPDNMLISNSGHLKLTDFGLSKVTMDYRASPQPGSYTPFDHRYGDYVDLRTPGQILSLKSSLMFTVDNTSCSKTSLVHNEAHQDVQVSTPTVDIHHKALPPQPQTPRDKSQRQSFGRRMLTPIDNKQILSRRLHSSVLSTPPVKSLTPTLQDSLTWRNSSASDSQSMLACSILQSALLSRVNGRDNLSVLSDNDNFKESCSNQQPCVTSEIDMSINSNNGSSFNKEGASHCSDCGDSIEGCKGNEEMMFTNLSSKKLQDPLSCDSHIMPVFRLEGEDDETPMLHRTFNSVWGSYAAKNLRSMRDGSYSEDNNHGSFCTSGHVNTKNEDVINPNCRSNFCQPLILANTPDASHLSDISMLETESVFTEVMKHSPHDSSDRHGRKQPYSDIFLSHDSNAFSNTSIEVARGVVSSFDESMGVIHGCNKSRLVSIAGSSDLEFSSDFSGHLQQKDQIFNSTRLSLDFGPTQMSLDSGPELKDLSQLSGLSRMVLRTLPLEDNTGAAVPHFNVVPSKKSESLIRKQNDLAPSSGPLVRKLSKPGLRRVLSDTFDRCVSSSPLESSSERSKNLMKNKSKSLDYSTFFGENISRLTDSNKLQRKRPFQNIVSDSSYDVAKKLDDDASAHTGMTPALCRMRMKENDDVRPRKQACVDRNHYVHNLFGAGSNCGKQVFSPSKTSASLLKISEKRIWKDKKTVDPISSTLNLRHDFSGSPAKTFNINSPPHHPKVAYLRESKSSHLACTGLTDEVNGPGLKDFVARKQINSKPFKVTDLKNETYIVDSLEGCNDGLFEQKSKSPERCCGDCSDIVHSRHPLHRVPASMSISSHNDSTSEDCSEDYTEENGVKFFIATPSPGPTMHSSPAPRNRSLSPLIMKKGVSTMDSSIGTDSSLLNVTIEYEGEGAYLEGRLSPLPVPYRRRSRSYSDSSLSDAGVTEPGFKLTCGGPNTFQLNQLFHPLSSLASRVLSVQGKQEQDILSLDELQQQKELGIEGGGVGDMIVGQQQRLFCSAHKKLPSIAEGGNPLYEEEEDEAVFAKPKCFVDTGPVQTPHPRKRDAVFQTPFCTPGPQSQTPVCGTGVRLQTPLRTPKSVRRGPGMTQEEGRILGTPDYLAPEILLQKPHGFAVDWWALGVCLYEFLTGLPPFNDQTPEAVFENILNRNITWPEEEEALGDESRAAIEALLTVDVDKRPAAKDVKAMQFFSSVDWTNLLNVEAPFIPHPEDHMDTTYFEPKNAVRNLVLSDVSM